MIHIMNSAMMPQAGRYNCRGPVTPTEAREFFEEYIMTGHDWRGYIGYPNTARVVGEVLGILCLISRDQTVFREGDVAIAFRLPYRVLPDEKSKNEHGRRVEDYEIFLITYQEDLPEWFRK